MRQPLGRPSRCRTARTKQTSRSILCALADATVLLLSTPLLAQTPRVALPNGATTLVAQAPATLGPVPLVPSLHLADRPGRARFLATETDLGTRIDQCVAAGMAAHDTPGAAVSVILDGVPIHSKGYGVKHRRNGGAVTAQTQFRIGSITKQMTAAVVMQQVELGRLDVGDRVTQHVPEFSLAPPYPASGITVKHLLTHTSGIPDLPFDLNGPTAASALGEWAAGLGSTRLHAPAGEFWNYSNPNYALAGLVAERAAGVPFNQLIQDTLWIPAGMTATTMSPASVVSRRDYAWGHFRPGPSPAETIYGPTSYDSAAMAPAGYAFSTAPDLARWALLLIDGGGPVLSPGSASALQARQVSLDYRPDMAYGFGIFSEDYKGLDLRQHGGNVPGWGSMLMWVPQRRFVVAVLGNTFESLTEAAYCIVDAALAPDGPWPIDDTTASATWDRYLGDYAMLDSLGDPLDATVAWNSGQLNIAFTDPDNPRFLYSTRMVQAFHDTFLIDGNADGTLDLDLTFVRSAPGMAPIRWLRNRSLVGERLVAPRRRAAARP